MKFILGTLLVLNSLSFGCSNKNLTKVTISKIVELEPPIKIRTVEIKFGKFNHGHGPYIWYKSSDKPDKEYWFWFSPKEGDVMPEDLQIVFITLVSAQDPDEFEVVWPEPLKNKNKREVFDLFYK